MDEATTTLGAMATKNAVYVGAFIAGCDFLGLMPISIVILMLFIGIDIIAGVLKSYSLHGRTALKSSVFERGVLAKVLIIGIPVNLALAGKGVGLDMSALAQGTITVLIFSELYSIMGNFYAIRTGEERVEFDAVAAVVAKVKTLLRHFIED